MCLLLSTLNVSFTTVWTQFFYAKKTSFMFLNDKCLANKFQNEIHKVKIYMNKNNQNCQ